jgi:hypothetical protein
MANRRMFSMKIIDTDAFMDMPQSSQLLYFHLAMNADDDGFVSNPKKIMRSIGSSDDDYKVLVAKKFIIPFESGVCVIKHWLIHNLIRSDRYTETQYVREKSKLFIDNKTKKYSLNKQNNINVIPNDNQMTPQVSIDKDRLDKDSISLPADAGEPKPRKDQEIWDIINLFKSVNPSYERLFSNKTQRASVERLLAKYGVDKLSATISALPEIIIKPYAPQITTPKELEDKLGKLLLFVNQEKSNKSNLGSI